MNERSTRTAGTRETTFATTVIPVLGIPVTFRSDHADIVAIAEEAFGAWHVIEQAPRLIADHRVTVTVQIVEGDEGPAPHSPLTYRQPDFTRVILSTPGSVGIADAARREAVLFATRSLIEDRQHFRYGVLEALTLAVLTKLDRQPLHAACITRNDTALLLAGPSGAGKSTLAYTAARAGYSILSEDFVNIQLEPKLRVWGMPGWLHLPVEAARHFDELSDRRPSLLANGKEKIAIAIDEIGASPRLPVAQRAGICLIERGRDEGVRIDTLDGATLQRTMLARLDPGFDIFAETIGECIRMLTSHGGWRLRLGSDPHRAIEHIGVMFEVLSGG